MTAQERKETVKRTAAVRRGLCANDPTSRRSNSYHEQPRPPSPSRRRVSLPARARHSFIVVTLSPQQFENEEQKRQDAEVRCGGEIIQVTDRQTLHSK
jgi:hypothetical protein